MRPLRWLGPMLDVRTHLRGVQRTHDGLADALQLRRVAGLLGQARAPEVQRSVHDEEHLVGAHVARSVLPPARRRHVLGTRWFAVRRRVVVVPVGGGSSVRRRHVNTVFLRLPPSRLAVLPGCLLERFRLEVRVLPRIPALGRHRRARDLVVDDVGQRRRAAVGRSHQDVDEGGALELEPAIRSQHRGANRQSARPNATVPAAAAGSAGGATLIVIAALRVVQRGAPPLPIRAVADAAPHLHPRLLGHTRYSCLHDLERRHLGTLRQPERAAHALQHHPLAHLTQSHAHAQRWRHAACAVTGVPVRPAAEQAVVRAYPPRLVRRDVHAAADVEAPDVDEPGRDAQAVALTPHDEGRHHRPAALAGGVLPPGRPVLQAARALPLLRRGPVAEVVRREVAGRGGRDDGAAAARRLNRAVGGGVEVRDVRRRARVREVLVPRVVARDLVHEGLNLLLRRPRAAPTGRDVPVAPCRQPAAKPPKPRGAGLDTARRRCAAGLAPRERRARNRLVELVVRDACPGLSLLLLRRGRRRPPPRHRARLRAHVPPRSAAQHARLPHRLGVRRQRRRRRRQRQEPVARNAPHGFQRARHVLELATRGRDVVRVGDPDGLGEASVASEQERPQARGGRDAACAAADARGADDVDGEQEGVDVGPDLVAEQRRGDEVARRRRPRPRASCRAARVTGHAPRNAAASNPGSCPVVGV
mmetsp:Transcript_27102/g.94022  ORF Transcript_27102/g.94022 Transcript_27102/m.94022 type:complete len:703 (+) Transcript_27102:444-2552(+)